MTTATEQPIPDEKPPFSRRHPCWYVFFIITNNLFALVSMVGFESIYRLDTGVLCAYVVICTCPFLILDRLLPTKKRKLQGWQRLYVPLFYVAFFVTFFALWFVFFAFVARFISPVTISRETTFLTEPRSNDGWIDFAAGYERQFLPSVPLEQNGYRTLAAALGKSVCGGDVIYWEPLCEKLELPPDLVPTVPLGQHAPFVDQQLFQQVLSRPWTMGEFPEIALWLDEQSALFDLLADSLRKEHFVLPVIHARKVDARKKPEIDMNLFAYYGYAPLRNLGVRLAYRIGLRLGSGDEAGALDDLETLYRLASACRVRLDGFIQLLPASTLESTANELSLQWLWTMNPNARQIDEWEARRKTVVHSAPIGDLVRLRRFCSLELIRQCSVPEFVFDKNDPEYWWKEFNFRFLRYCPWDRHLRDLNRHYDACTVAMNRPYRVMSPVTGMFSDMKEDPDSKSPLLIAAKYYFLKGSFGFYIAVMTEIMSGAMIADLNFDAYFMIAADDCCTETAYALERYHCRHGNYPSSLKILKEAGIIADIPIDPCAREARPLQYCREKNGRYALYSVGRNGIDDGGRRYSGDSAVPKSADDIRVSN